MKLLFSILLFSISLISFAQKKIGFDTTVLVGKDMQIFSQRNIRIDSSGNIYIAGYFKDKLVIENDTIVQKSPSIYYESKAIFLAKFDKNFHFQWLKKIAECDTLGYCSFELNKQKNKLYFAIYFTGTIYFESDSLISKGGKDIAFLQYNDIPIIINKLHIGNTNDEGVATIAITFDENNNYYLSGYFNGTWNGGYQNYSLIIENDTLFANNADKFIAKFNENDNLAWVRSYGGNGEDLGGAPIQFQNNNIYYASHLHSYINNNIGGIVVNFNQNYNSTNIIAKLDTNGNAIWVRKLGDKYYNNVLSNAGIVDIKAIGDRVYITGYGFSNDLPEFMFEGGPNLLGTGALNYECFLACYDTAGNFKWRTLVPNVEYISELITDSNYNVIGIGSGPAELHVVCYDSTGNNLWNLFGTGFGALCTTQGNGIAKNTNGKLYVVGGTDCSNGFIMGNDTLYPPPMQSTLFFASIDSIDIQYPANVYEVNNNHFTIYPNPTYNELIISYPVATEATITITNTIGQTVISDKIIGSSHKIQTSNIPNGIYFITIKNNQYSYTQKIIIHH